MTEPPADTQSGITEESSSQSASKRNGQFQITKPNPTTRLASIWDHRLYFVAVTLFGLSLGPFLVFIVIGIWENNLFLPGENVGFLEAPSFISIFPVLFLTLLAVRYALDKQYDTLQAFNESTVRLNNDTSPEYPNVKNIELSSTLEPNEFQALLDCYNYLLAKVTFRGSSVTCPEEYAHIPRRFRQVFLLLATGGGIILAVTTSYHWFSESVYGFDIWASSTYPTAFFARFVFEAIILFVVGPLVVTQLLILGFINFHSFRFLQRRNALQSRRFAIDGVGGFGVFGDQAFRVVLVLAPLSIPLGTYALFLPVTPLLIAGILLYVSAIPILFIIQLYSTHQAMEYAKQIELSLIGNAYDENYENYKNILISADSIAEMDDEKLVTHHEAMEKADSVYEKIQNRPTWPFSGTIISKVVSLTLSILSGMLLIIAEGLIL